jgi:hypothetical protein
MRYLYSGMLLSMLTLPVFARSDGALTSAFVKQSPRASSVAYRAFGAASAHKTSSATQSANTSIQKTDSVTQQADSAISETVNAEKEACLANNLATGNTFVYASINSNTSNYASMVEDVVNPGNNACYVRVNLTSSDSSVDLSDMPVRYFKMDKTVTCGQWVEEATLQERVLESKKKGRAWAIAGAAVGGAALGVGAMELFGNKLIGGKVEGQAALTGTELLCSQLKVLKEKNNTKYQTLMDSIKKLQPACADASNKWDKETIPELCRKYDFDYLIKC